MSGAFVTMFVLLASSPDATRLFDAGRAAIKTGKIDEACVAFEGSYTAEPALGTLLNLADCFEKQKKFASAFTRFNEAATWASRTKESEREKFAQTRAKALKPRLSWLAVTANMPCTVEVENEKIELDSLPISIPFNLGKHSLIVNKVGFEPYSKTIELTKEDETLTLNIDLQAIPVAKTVVITVPAGDAPVVETPTAASVDATTNLVPVLSQPSVVMVNAPSQTPATALIVSGGLLAVAGGVGLIWSLSTYSRVQAQRLDGVASGDVKVTEAEFNTMTWMIPAAGVAAGVGALALGTGVVMLAIQKPVTVAPTIGKGTAGLTVSGRF